MTWSSPRSQIGSHISHVHSTGASAALAAARQTCTPTKLDRHIHRACCVVLRSTTIRVHPHPHIPLLPASCGQLCLSPGTCRVHAPSSGVVPTSSMTKDPRPCLSLPCGLEGFFRLHSHRLPYHAHLVVTLIIRVQLCAIHWPWADADLPAQIMSHGTTWQIFHLELRGPHQMTAGGVVETMRPAHLSVASSV